MPLSKSTIDIDVSDQELSALNTASLSEQSGKQLSYNNDIGVVRNSLVAGSISGMASTICLYPLDVIRTKLQALPIRGTTAKQLGPAQMFRETIQYGGVRALYTGMALPLAAQAAYKGTVFTVNNVANNLLLRRHADAQLSIVDRFLCGALGGGVNALIFVTPVEFVRNQLIAQHSKLAAGHGVVQLRRGSWDVIHQSVKSHGIRSLWRGASWSVARDVWGCGWFFVTMFAVQSTLTLPGEEPSFSATVVSGACSGLMFWVASLPLDTVKTWVQSADLAVTPVNATGSIGDILRQKGIGGLLHTLSRGWQVAFARGLPSSAITMTVYSYTYRHLQPDESATVLL
jgi:hypothetical protein